MIVSAGFMLVFGASCITTSSSSTIQEVYAAAEHCTNKCVDKHQEHNRQSDPLLSNLAVTPRQIQIMTRRQIKIKNNNNIPFVLPFP